MLLLFERVDKVCFIRWCLNLEIVGFMGGYYLFKGCKEEYLYVRMGVFFIILMWFFFCMNFYNDGMMFKLYYV